MVLTTILLASRELTLPLNVHNRLLICYTACLRVTAGRRKVSEEEAQGEDDVAASLHRRSQGEQQAARANKKARRHKGPSFYNQVFKALKEKEELLKKREERLAKEAAAAASKQLHCTCWWSDAPYMPSKSEAVEEDSGDDSQN
jgi:hypothetical protein